VEGLLQKLASSINATLSSHRDRYTNSAWIMLYRWLPRPRSVALADTPAVPSGLPGEIAPGAPGPASCSATEFALGR
jgi:hypothetical protein